MGKVAVTVALKCLTIGMLLQTSCGANQAKVGAVMAGVGLVAVAGGVGVATSHCAPSGDFCRDTMTGRPEVGIPIAAVGGLLVISGITMVATGPGASGSGTTTPSPTQLHTDPGHPRTASARACRDHRPIP